MKLLGSTGVVKKVGLVEWGFRLCQDSRVHGLLLSPLVLSPRRLPCLAPFGSAKGPPGLLRGDLRAVFGSQKPPGELQESSRGRRESPKEAPGRPQGGHKEAPEVHRRSSKGPWGAENNVIYMVVSFRSFQNRCKLRASGASTLPKPWFGYVFRPRTSAKPSLLGPFVLRSLQNTRDLGPQTVSK